MADCQLVAQLSEALPYLRSGAKVSTKALAMVVLDAHDPQSQTVGNFIRIPAQCTHTREPILVSGRIVQLGAGVLNGAPPSQALRVEEVPNVVLRAVVFKDELDVPWEQFVQRPVREIINSSWKCWAVKDRRRCWIAGTVNSFPCNSREPDQSRLTNSS